MGSNAPGGFAPFVLRSMTGYGKAVASAGGRAAVVEVRTVNHRFLDLAVRLPRGFAPVEHRVRQVVQDRIRRGRVEVAVSVDDPTPAAPRVRVDTDLLAAVRGALEEARWRLDSPHPVTLGDLLRVPGWLQVGEAEAPSDEEANWELVRPALEAALADAVSMREREGQALQADILSRTETVRELARQVRERAPTVVEEMARRLSRRVEELAGHAVDPQRIAAEVAIMAERADVSEEIARIGSHLDQLVALAEQGGLCGRKLDFLLQELQREWNTVGSKAGDARISQWVVEAKTELERIREQVQNIE